MWNDRVVQHAAHAADSHIAGATFATGPQFRLVVDAAPRCAVAVPQEPDPSVLPPPLAPRVLHEPVGVPRHEFLAEAHENNSVVNYGVSATTVKDTPSIGCPTSRGHGDGHRSKLHHSTQQRQLLVLRQSLPAVHAEACGEDYGRRSCVFCATAILHSVGHVVLLGATMLHNPRHGQLHSGTRATTATPAVLWIWHTRNQLLRRERAHSSLVNLGVRLQHCGASDGPARAARSLVANHLRRVQIRPVSVARDGCRLSQLLPEERCPTAAKRCQCCSLTAHPWVRTTAPAPKSQVLLLGPVPQVVHTSSPAPVCLGILRRGFEHPLFVDAASHLPLPGPELIRTTVELDEDAKRWKC
mmetsp:Transcript_92314/g.214499  ORF Transcript_92314/g.214499 Transcript_92314/m.214499 type:complete len:356 (-) Transcript_92314:124-1191(-)